MIEAPGKDDLDGGVGVQEVGLVGYSSVDTFGRRNDPDAESMMGDDQELKWGG